MAPDISTGYRWIITLGFIAIVVVLTTTPDRGQPADSAFSWLITNTAPFMQKILHVVCYATMAGLWMWTLEALEPRMLRIAATLILSVGLGAGLELYQTQVPGRFGSLSDVLLNAAGAVAGLLFALLVL